MKNCTNCKHAIFDEIWGEYKCTVYETTIEYPYDVDPCSKHVKGTPKHIEEDEEE